MHKEGISIINTLCTKHADTKGVVTDTTVFNETYASYNQVMTTIRAGKDHIIEDKARALYYTNHSEETYEYDTTKKCVFRLFMEDGHRRRKRCCDFCSNQAKNYTQIKCALCIHHQVHFGFKERKPLKFEKSFASYTGETASGKKKVDCWIPTPDEWFPNSNTNNTDNTVVFGPNGNRTPQNTARTGNIIAYFQCDNEQCKSIFYKFIPDVVSDDLWCPCCSSIGTSSILCGRDSCTYCYERSFASYEEEIEITNPDGTTTKIKKKHCWSSKNKKKPIEQKKGSTVVGWFDCPNCPHEFPKGLNLIIRGV